MYKLDNSLHGIHHKVTVHFGNNRCVFVYCVSNVSMYYPQISNCKISTFFGKGSGLTSDEVLIVSTEGLVGAGQSTRLLKTLGT